MRLHTFPILSPIPLVAVWGNDWVGLSCWMGLKPIQNSTTTKDWKLKTKRIKVWKCISKSIANYLNFLFPVKVNEVYIFIALEKLSPTF